MAGVSRLQYTPEIKIVRLMCTGRVDPALVAKAFKKGIDGLMVVGCYFGDCHYITGNHQAKAKMDMTRKLFKFIGLNEDRLAFRQCSSGEASVFVELVSEFDQKILDIGPLGGDGDTVKAPEIFKKLEAAEAVLAGEKIRWIIGKRTPFLETGNMYGEVFTEHEFNRAIDMIIVEEMEVQEILARLKETARSVKDLANDLTIPPARVFRYISALKRKGMVALDTVAGQTPIFQIARQEV
ncbi:MAG: hydrogenase iron-sulfur subunit [Desulfobacteraceae bacterium]|uniref:Hydrogenase iron-sulfur subunit n=1 Tax=Candidatus Desulfacyla euxinica TaxID=2841693 RepID=A0A8J6T7G4_9DELT|nr:hydrogenase iron-sulfur subunit [Candidatus Desulfacyla euxinica]MBL6978756.1 hydrogenase iron-sulfur subunit [Desulfobacteraceae bacterium]